MTIRIIILSLFVAALAALPAYADIGAIGSPVKPSNGVLTDTTPNSAPLAASEDSDERTPLLIIRFNQQHVYFDRVLRQAVEVTEKAKPGAFYDVVSIVPAGASQGQSERLNAAANDNLNAVLQQMQSLGVQPAQIHTTTQSSSTMTAQEVDIFVD